ncbi:T9SS type A sorting domain-containing protein [Calditrichota bacterium]
MIKQIVPCVVVFSFICLFAQPPNTSWQKTYGGAESERGNCVRQTTDGGYIIAGWTDTYDIDWVDAWLVKTNSSGDTLWTKTFGGNSEDKFNEVRQTTDGGYIIVGTTGSLGAGLDDVWLIKTDQNGNQQWAKTFGANGQEQGNSVYQTVDGGYIITGSSKAYGSTFDNLFLIKTTSSGDTIWTKKYGGPSWDIGNSVQETNDGGYIIAGKTSSYGAGSQDVWLIKTTASGDTLWTKTFGGSSGDGANSIQQTSDNGFIIAGYKDSNGPNRKDFWLIKTDAFGNLVWDNGYGGDDDDEACSVQQTSDGGYILAGYTESYGDGLDDIWVVKTNAFGGSVWSKVFTGSYNECSNSVQQTTDGGYIITGYTSTFGAGGSDIWLIKTEPDLSIINTEQYVPGTYHLFQNYPNPFNPITTIKFRLSQRTYVKVDLFNLAGQKITSLVSEQLNGGFHELKLDASALASGIYMYRLQCGAFTDAKKLLVLK